MPKNKYPGLPDEYRENMSKNLKDVVIRKEKLKSIKNGIKYRQDLLQESLDVRDERWKRTLTNQENLRNKDKDFMRRMKTKSAM